MNCQDAREHFSALLDAHIGLTERVPLEAHLRECEACQKELEGLRLGERPHPAAWRPNLKLDFFSKAPDFSKALDRMRPTDMVERLRQRLFPRNPVIRRARSRPVLFGKTLEMPRASHELSPRRSVHARERVPWRSRPGVARAAKALASVRGLDIAGPLRRTGSSLHLTLRRVASALESIGESLEVAGKAALDGGGKALQAAKKALGIGRKAFGLGGKALGTGREALGIGRKAFGLGGKALGTGREALGIGRKALGIGGKAFGLGGKALGIGRRVLESARQMLLLACALAVLLWDHRRIFLPVQARHLRLTATVLLVSLGAVGLFRYRAELDLAVRRWVPSAPSSGDATLPTRMASTEPATRPEIPPVTAPVTVVPAPPELHPAPAPRAPGRPTPEMPARVVAPPAGTKSAAPPPEPVTPRRAPAPSPPVRDTRVSRVEKPDATKSERIETPAPKAKNGSAKQDKVAAPAPRRDNPVETRSASAPSASDARPSLDVVGKLRVKNRSGAERHLAALLAKAGGTTVSRQRGEKITVIEAVVPNPSYGKFAEGLTRIGSWQVEAGRSPLPDPVRVTLRLAE
jgi:hypothetical protein